MRKRAQSTMADPNPPIATTDSCWTIKSSLAMADGNYHPSQTSIGDQPPPSSKNPIVDGDDDLEVPGAIAIRGPLFFSATGTDDISVMDNPEGGVCHRASSTRSLPHTVVAETIPEFVIATAVPERLGEDDEEAPNDSCFCFGVRCGSIGKNSKSDVSRRRLYLLLAAALVVIAIAVGVSVNVTSSNAEIVGVAGPPSLSSITTPVPASSPTRLQTEVPTSPPTRLQTKVPTLPPAQLQTKVPTLPPTRLQTKVPTFPPTRLQTEMPTLPPTRGQTEVPTLPPTPLQTKELFTTLESTHVYFGHMFDITAKNDLTVIALQIHMESTGLEDIEVWTKEGEYHGFETNQFQWAMIGEATVVAKGPDELTPLPRDLFRPVRVSAGTKQAFYVVTSTQTIYFQERKNAAGDHLIDYGDATEFSNSDLEINVGTGVQYRFIDQGPPNIFNGAIEYALVG